MTQTTLAVTSEWLNANGSTAGSLVGGTTTNCNLPWNPTPVQWPYWGWPTYYYSYSGPSRPIKLTLSEVERLRAAAKRDAKLKAILAKFTDLIEITVDFE